MLCENFKYPKLMRFFEEISAIPRMSYHEDKIADYLVDFAKARVLEYYRDEVHNVLINIGATKGYEDREPILLQGHTDMVCQKNEGVEHDFLSDGLELYVDNGYIKARGTTLGADDGVAVAFMLALLDGAIEHHPRCQCLFTSAEETGLDGMTNFDFSRIYAKKMINMDGCEDDIIIVGCAGGIRHDVVLEATPEAFDGAECLSVSVGGLIGGHSGENIGDGRANACKIAGELLSVLFESFGARIVTFEGGDKTNAIPREAKFRIALDRCDDAISLIKSFEEEKKRYMCSEDSDFFIRVKKEQIERVLAFTLSDTRRIVDLVSSARNGVLKMSDTIKGLVQYSRNLGIVRLNEKGIEFNFSSRSSVEEDIDDSVMEMNKIAKEYGAACKSHSRYPAWTYTGLSELADSYTETAKRLYGLEVRSDVIHAGLECGIVKQKAPDMEIITCGANARNIHSPAEALEIASFERFFGILSDMLAGSR